MLDRHGNHYSFSDVISNIGKGFSNFTENFLPNLSDAFLGTNFHGDKVNQEIANQNIAFQKQENEITREREDNAVQRAAADMTAAGFSRTLAAGNPASAQSLSAPNNSYRYSAAIDRMNLYERMKSLYYQDRADKRSEELNNAQVDASKAEAALKYSQAAGQNLSNDVFIQNNTNEQLLVLAKTAQANSQVKLNDYNARIAQIVGDNKQEEIDSDINLNIAKYYETLASTSVKNEEKNQIVQKIKNLVAEEYNLGKMGELLVEQIIYEKLKQAGYQHDLDYAGLYGLPVGKPVGGVLGQFLAGSSFIDGSASGLSLSFNPSLYDDGIYDPETGTVNVDEIRRRVYGK